MSDIIYYKNGEKTFRISPPTVETKCPETKLEVKKMNEIQKTEGEIKVLQSKLELLKEMENFKTPCEIAYKDAYGEYPMGEPFWIVFKKGYEAHQSLVDDANKIRAAVSMIDCTLEGNPPNGCSAWREWFELFGSKGILNGLRLSSINKKKPKSECPDEPLEYDEVEWDISETAPEVTTENALLEAYKATFGKYPTVGSSASKFDIQSWNIFQYGFRFGCGELQSSVDDDSEETASQEPTPNKFLQRILDGKINERGYVDLREPTTVFRQKLFDGIKSVFYDPDYERTHWKLKVDMAVDEVLTHFYDVIPDMTEPVDNFDKGWNACLEHMKSDMEYTND